MIEITPNEIEVERATNALRHPDAGAVISYLGTVRSYLEGKQSQGLGFEVSDAEMRARLEEVESEALGKFEIKDMTIVHRTGFFNVGDSILLIAISSGHRGPAFDACQFIVDRIKVLHDVWKREILQN